MSDYQNPNQPPQRFYASPLAGPPRGLSVASMVIGLVSILAGFTFVVPIVGLVLGIVGIRREPAGRAMSLTGIILNGVILLGWVIIALLFITVGIAGFGAATGNYS
jgi:hypothetical protein